VNESRALAFEIIDRVLREDAYLHLLLRSSLSGSRASESDRAFVTELATGTVRFRDKLDYALSFFLDRPLSDVDPAVLNALRMGAYQVLEMRVAEHAAVFETVEVAKTYLGRGPSSFVNAVLRGMARKPEKIVWPDPDDTITYISVVHSHPKWLVEYLVDTFGKERALSLCRSANRKAPLTIRVNTRMHPVETYASRLEEAGVEFSPGCWLPEALTNLHLPGPMLVGEWEGGHYVVQDESSMLVSRVLDPQPGEFIVDTCSAPGGKTTHLAQLSNDTADILAIDNQPRRLDALQKMVANLGLTSIRFQVADSRHLSELLRKPADRILLDAPCSGLGTLRRRPDIKWKRRREDLRNLAKTQSALLDAAAPALKAGGVMVYSVCTITPEETVERVEEFLATHPGFTLEEPGPFCPLGEPLPQERPEFIQTYPDLHALDGMFIARLRKS
jgi:16S rRNA (cytosine967-C5)-methyltransferase